MSDRDRILEQALTHELKAARTASAGACLDAETLGGWTDGRLDPAAAAACEAHVSSCERCRQLVATMARGAVITAADATRTEASGTMSWWKWWLAPIAAGVTAATLWMVVPEQQQLATAPPHRDAGSIPDTRAVAPATEPQANEAIRSAPAPAPALRDGDLAAAARADQQQKTFADERKQVVRPETAAKEEAAGAQLRERAAVGIDAAAPPAPAIGAVAQAPPPPAAVALQRSARLESAAIEVHTLDSAQRWRIAGARIERTDDGGRTWTLKREQPDESISAGSAASNTVAWFVGRGGLVLMTADSGATFNDVSLAEPLDIASVSAADARTASIFTVSGRRLRTEDGGRTWRPF